ncbi:hypothetical protein KDW_38030 [Dictyobacter vulcani]|uniref:Pentapeptide repeat-containing protein n=1 Tax=Dictyobacter vulcani TaxID=2607529 RepID=A0A5J4KT66_9CHLR|nr:pentapeptide repeat-containing protein [Dictyobacter vulcani]GER89641.1 hypothetical protein KDW_38030 [Dictyobacter vulcani]
MSDATEPIQPWLEDSARPSSTNREEWQAYWQACGLSWRTEPEIDSDRQAFLAYRVSILPDIVRGIYPFKDIALSRADLEWLLLHHEDDRGPVQWNDERQRERLGLDVRGSDLRRVHLQALPLARLRAALTWDEWTGATAAQRLQAQAQLEYCDFSHAHLEGAILNRVQLQHTRFTNAFMEQADLSEAQLQHTQLTRAHLQHADLRKANLRGATLREVQCQHADLSEATLQGCDLSKADFQHATLRKIFAQQADFSLACLDHAYLHDAHLDEVNLRNASLQKVDLSLVYLTGASLLQAQLQQAYLRGAHLEQADLRRAHLEGADLSRVHLAGASLQGAFFDRLTCLDGVLFSRAAGIDCASLADIHWDAVNLAGIDWSVITKLGDERQLQLDGSRQDAPDPHLVSQAVRAYHQLAHALRNYGLYEEAHRFLYSCYRLQCRVLWVQARQRKISWNRRIRLLVFWLGFLCLDIFAGYGYQLSRLLPTYLSTICLFGLLYFITGFILQPAHPLTWYAALALSVSAFHGQAFWLNQPPANYILVFLTLVERVLGFLFTILIVTVILRRFLHT